MNHDSILARLFLRFPSCQKQNLTRMTLGRSAAPALYDPKAQISERKSRLVIFFMRVLSPRYLKLDLWGVSNLLVTFKNFAVEKRVAC